MNLKDLPVRKGFHVHQERRQMMHKVAVAFFLSRTEGCLTTPVSITGAHLMLFILETGLIVLMNAPHRRVRMEPLVKRLRMVTVVSRVLQGGREKIVIKILTNVN